MTLEARAAVHGSQHWALGLHGSRPGLVPGQARTDLINAIEAGETVLVPLELLLCQVHAPDARKVERYAAMLDALPPVSVVPWRGRLVLTDGGHRVSAAAALGRSSIPAQLDNLAGPMRAAWTARGRT